MIREASTIRAHFFYLYNRRKRARDCTQLCDCNKIRICINANDLLPWICYCLICLPNLDIIIILANVLYVYYHFLVLFMHVACLVNISSYRCLFLIAPPTCTRNLSHPFILNYYISIEIVSFQKAYNFSYLLPLMLFLNNSALTTILNGF